MLNEASFGPDGGKAEGSGEGSLEKFSQMTHFPRAESLDGNMDLEFSLWFRFHSC